MPELKQVIFVFGDNSTRILEGEELEYWITICYTYSDYLLPGDPDHVLAGLYQGIIRGFVPGETVREE